MNLFDKVFPPRTITLANGKQIKKPRSRAPLYAVVLLVMAAVSVEVTGFDLGVLVRRIGGKETSCWRSRHKTCAAGSSSARTIPPIFGWGKNEV